MVERRYNAVAWESSTFDNVQVRRNSSFIETRWLFANNNIYKPFLLSSRARSIWQKWNHLPKRHGAGPSAAASVVST